MTQQAPSQPFQYASDFLADDTPPPSGPPPAPPGSMTVDQRLFALETGQVAILKELKTLGPTVKRLKLESQILKVIKSSAFLAAVTAAGNIAMAQMPGAKQWIPALIEFVRVTQ